MANAPVAKLRDFSVSTAIFEWTNDGKKSYSISLQRSYKKKDSNEYTNESINMYPEDLLRTANLLINTYNKYNEVAWGDKKESAPVTQPTQGWTETKADLKDDIPF